MSRLLEKINRRLRGYCDDPDCCPPETDYQVAYEDGYSDGFQDGMEEMEDIMAMEKELDEMNACYSEAKIPDRAPDE